ncbi:tetratricopeptide repeat protein [Oceanisphaera sp. W20_SRM_FM3]|uniref:tetratricopeptide repeat protein n=1 Tax=Oceanisphaera sp. W20_SRM_FM3 TaxID=3240267 RepID=UPI003F9A72CC
MMKIRLGLFLLYTTIGVSVAQTQVQAQTQEQTQAQTKASSNTASSAPGSIPMAKRISTAASGAKLTSDAAASVKNTDTQLPDADDIQRSDASEVRAASDAAVAALADGELRAVPLYEEYELLEWINSNRHLQQVRDKDDCQLVQDIEARAEVLRLPAYQFLWGDMLAWGVCVPQQSRRGLTMLWKAAEQGLPAALEQLGRYYYDGTLVQKNRERAEPLMQEAASLGFEKAQFTWARWLLSGSGSPLDYPQAYLWLKEMILDNQKQHQEAQRLSTALAARMPAHKVKELNHRLMF